MKATCDYRDLAPLSPLPPPSAARGGTERASGEYRQSGFRCSTEVGYQTKEFQLGWSWQLGQCCVPRAFYALAASCNSRNSTLFGLLQELLSSKAREGHCSLARLLPRSSRIEHGLLLVWCLAVCSPYMPMTAVLAFTGADFLISLEGKAFG